MVTHNDIVFVAIDGEGVTRPGTNEHIYDMLSVGDRTLTSPDGGQLQWWEIFDFLWNEHRDWCQGTPARTRLVYVGFYLSYDFTQWCRTMPEEDAHQLWDSKARERRKVTTRTGTEVIKPHVMHAPDGSVWKVDILAKKRFDLSRVDDEKLEKLRPMYICDTGGYFQTSFVNVIAPKGVPNPKYVTQDEWKTIKEGKADRDEYLTLDQQLAKRRDTIRYNRAENRALVKVMHELNEGMEHMGLRLPADKWYGPGQAAQAWMASIGIADADDNYGNMPTWAYKMAQASYYGGWFEIFYHGYIPGKAYEYDINSAYPHVIASLPCLQCGTWTDTLAERAGDTYSLLRIRGIGINPDVGPLPFRTPTGRILRPLAVEGVYWRSEIEAAQRAGLLGDYEILEVATYTPAWACQHGVEPFRPIRDLYNERLRAPGGKNGPQGKAMKLVYNSAYGKMAQSIGKPRFANAMYASLITSGCRTMILDAIATHPRGTDDLLMVATDGVYFRTPHPGLKLSEENLGAWDETLKENMTLLMPGVYWDERARIDPSTLSVKSRGISAVRLQESINGIDRMYQDTRLSILERLQQTIDIYSTFHMWSCGQALAANDWARAGTIATYIDDTTGVTRKGARKRISLDPFPKRDTTQLRVHNGAIRSGAYPVALERGRPIAVSTPYARHFGRELDVILDLGAVLDKDYEGVPISFASQYADQVAM